MNNNDILRRLRYTFDIRDEEMVALFASHNLEVSRSQLQLWLKKEVDPAFENMEDVALATFLNAFIESKRGKKDGPSPVAEKRLNNNIIFRKIRIALSLKDDEILRILALSGRKISKHELSAFFRKPIQPQYRPCQDQILRNFLQGLQTKHRGGKS